MKLSVGATTIALLTVFAFSAQAADRPTPGHKIDIKVKGAKERLKVIAKDKTFAAPSPAGADDPTRTGATIRVSNPATGEEATFIMPAAGWTVNGSGTSYRFRNKQAPSGISQVKKAQVKRNRVKVDAPQTGISLDEPTQGSLIVEVTMGTLRVCMDFGGQVKRDEPGRFLAKKASAPTECPGGPAPTTTTSTTLADPFCGNTLIDAGEQCDPPGSTCGGIDNVCNSDCTCACDFLDDSVCMYPFPSDFLTVEDVTTPTGRRVHFSQTGMPKNASGKPIEPSDYNYADGFSPGALIAVKVPDVDLAMTGAAPIIDIERSLDANAPIVIINADTGQRHMMWAEIDSLATADENRSVQIRPAVNLEEEGRYIVALRNMKNSAGDTLAPSAAFLAYRDNTPTVDPVIEARRPHMEQLFTELGSAGIARNDLYLAWDFTVASAESTTKRLLFLRDDGFARLGAAAPNYVVTATEDEVDGNTFRTIQGTYLVERYVNTSSPSARYLIGPDELPLWQPTPQQANFWCVIPRAALADATSTAVPARASIYGHGLFGSGDQVYSGHVKAMANEHNFVFCATDFIGMATEDVPNALATAAELSNFSTLPDRLQQSVLNFLFLARLMIHPDGFSSNPLFQDLAGNSVIDTDHVFYDGNSQGGIAGGMIMSVAQDITRGVLGVPAINYSTLLQRSVDFDPFAIPLYNAYPDETARPLLFSLIQMLWDRGEPNGYAHHMTDDPLPNTPPHNVLLQVAFGDHQVANVATEVQARTIGASVYQPALGPGRHSDVDPYFAIPPIATFPFGGSALVIWDTPGVPTPPITNEPPRVGSDPHSKPRNTPAARLQKSEFLKPDGVGMVVDTCGAAPCMAP